MSAVAYSYCVLRYVHDPVAAESLNIGVLVYAPSTGELYARLDHRYERLSKAFADFDGEHYRDTIRGFESAIERLCQRLHGSLFDNRELPQDATAIGNVIWPDQDLSYRVGEALGGIAERFEPVVDRLFHRLVVDQRPRHESERRDDEEVWSVYRSGLARVMPSLRPTTIRSELVEIEFPHAFKNEKWHLLQPVSFDLTRSSSIQRKALQWLGNATALHGHPELGKLYLLLGRPHGEHLRAAYERAREVLEKVPVPHRIISEEEAPTFAREFADFVDEHQPPDDFIG